jgi:hypothetical protein
MTVLPFSFPHQPRNLSGLLYPESGHHTKQMSAKGPKQAFIASYCLAARSFLPAFYRYFTTSSFSFLHSVHS